MDDTDGTTDEDEVQLAPPDSLLGQLQRGRGAGYLWALTEPPATVHPLLIECITHDPRWDHQIEQREDYYARLAVRTGLNPTPLDNYLRTAADELRSWKTELTIGTLGSMACFGNRAAIGILSNYVAYGVKWDAALQELVVLPAPHATVGLAEVLCARFSTGVEMDESAIYGSLAKS
jgi:hypothetical protein